MNSYGDLTNIWTITPEERNKHDLKFFQLNPVAGYLNGDQAKYFFLQSNLPTPILAQIWKLSDLTADGQFDQKEFSIAMHLIQRFFEGITLPPVLPPSLLIDPLVKASPCHNSLTFPIGQPLYSSTLPRNSNMVTSNNMKTLSPQSKPYAISSSNEWGIPQNLRLRYKQTFNTHDHSHKGYITGLEAKSILVQSGLTHSTLAQIWSLADVDTDGNLSPDEFCIAMYLIDEARMGRAIPKSLPPELLPPSSRKFRRMSETVTPLNTTLPLNHNTVSIKSDTFEDLLSNFPLQNNSIVSNIQNNESAPFEQEVSKIVTFEDKRKENFDKGQAELEKRRLMLLDMQQQESRERLAAEKAEQERWEKIKLEQDAKKQQEMEKQLEKQKLIELEKEEQRRKAIEQRETARRDMERQRQLEWERQQQDQLNIEKLREHSEKEQLKHQSGQLKLQLDSYEAKKNQIIEKLDQAFITKAEFEANITEKRLIRDTKLSTIEKLQAENEEFEMTRVAAQQESIRLSRQVNSINSQTDKNKENILASYSSKELTLDKLMKKIKDDESEFILFNEKIKDISEHLDMLNVTLDELKLSCSKLELEINKKKKNCKQNNVTSKLCSDSVSTLQNNLHNMNSKNESEKQILSEKQNLTEVFNEWNNMATTMTGIENTESSLALTDARIRAAVPSVMGFTDLWSGVTTTQSSTDAWAEDSNKWDSLSTAFGNDNTWPDAFNKRENSENLNDVWVNCDIKENKQLEPKIDWASNFTENADDGEIFSALFKFEARNSDELSLQSGDSIIVYKQDQVAAEPGWTIGHIGTRIGCFPSSYATKQNPVHLPAKDSGSIKNEINQLMPYSEFHFMPAEPSTSTPPHTNADSQVVHESIKAQALYPWLAKKDNHLSFKKGDIIFVSEQQDNWWSGRLNDKFGWFPKNYVSIVTNNQEELHNEIKSIESVHNNGNSDLQSEKTNEELVVALYSYTSAEPTDLNFKQGDVFKVKKMDGDWWFGTLNDKSGIFPANYVQKMDAISASKIAVGKKPEIAQVIAPYDGTSHEQLSLQVGQLIHVRKKNSSGWWEGELQAKGQKRRVGWFPADYVKLLGGNIIIKSTPDLLTSSLSITNHQNSAFVPSFRSEQVLSLYAYKGQQPDELSFEKGVTINVIEKQDSDWWKGELGGITGMFPANYVTSLSKSNDNSHLHSMFNLSTS